MAPPHLIVLTPVDPSVQEKEEQKTKNGVLRQSESEKDGMETFNHPRERRHLILQELVAQRHNISGGGAPYGEDYASDPRITFQVCSEVTMTVEEWKKLYEPVHSNGLLEFLSTAWTQWAALGPEGQDPGACKPTLSSLATPGMPPPLIPINTTLPRDPYERCPPDHVIGKIGYYCTDTCTPVFQDLFAELLQDATLMEMAVDKSIEIYATAAAAGGGGRGESSNNSNTIFYILQTHPGHHAANDSFGGYCYVNHAAAAASRFLHNSVMPLQRVAVLDVDYHAGNGTASIFYNRANVLVISLHCDPNFDYPFHAGFADQTGAGAGMGATMHLPLPPHTTWSGGYEVALRQAMDKIQDFGAQALVVSLGLDTAKDVRFIIVVVVVASKTTVLLFFCVCGSICVSHFCCHVVFVCWSRTTGSMRYSTSWL
jgi:acetoin utilization deacetylase AcuC-like enzyme